MNTAFSHLQLSAAELERFELRLARVRELPLLEGSHEADQEIAREMCVMEAVSYIAGEPWSESPACVCPTITALMVAWNDGLPTDADRDRLLKPLIPKLIGTSSGEELREPRAFMALDWLVRTHVPAWLDLVEDLKPAAIALRELPEVVDLKTALACGDSLKSAAERAAAARAAARAAAWDAARAAAWDAARAAARAAARDAARAAARAAAWDAARAAAWDAAWDAARDAARAAAWDAARAAAWDAAWDAARAAAWDALKPTVEQLQTSAQQLVLRMCEATI
jgi:hypothetical protein